MVWKDNNDRIYLSTVCTVQNVWWINFILNFIYEIKFFIYKPLPKCIYNTLINNNT